ncbi:hypothetical protein ACFUN7_01510 [Streptomyces sp. NPDC057236]|uniref:hypothetical protein n=1 Tax=Streptomyces sp. NPDC057236 TaxID=3346059 RepID=UPI003644785A
MPIPLNTSTDSGTAPPPEDAGWLVWARRWPRWAPYAAAVWGGAYAVVQAVWAVTSTTVPLTPDDSYTSATQGLLASVGVVAAGAGLAATRTWAGWRHAATTVSLCAAVLVYLLGAASLPAHFVTLASGSGVESATGLANVLLHAAGAGLLIPATLSFRRRHRNQCPRCGRFHEGRSSGALVHPAPSVASRRTRTAVFLLMGGLLPWAGVKTIWTLGGDAIGVTAEGWRDGNADASGIVKALASVGIDVTVLAAAAAIFLLLGLMYPWGQVFPRWTLLLSGRRVPRLLPLLPAWATAFGLSLYGVFILVVFVPLTALGVLPEMKPTGAFTTSSGLLWMAAFGGMAFTGLGFGLVLAARSYATRTRPVCAGAGTPVPAPAD